MTQGGGASSGTGGYPDEALVRQFLLGEARAVARVETMIVHVVRSRGYYIPRQDHPDLVQEVMLQVYQAFGRHGFSFTRDFDAFVRSIVHRRCVD